jgi:hypothetical protein
MAQLDQNRTKLHPEQSLAAAVTDGSGDMVMVAGKPRQTLWRIYAKRAILAGGATERPIAFENNDRPGVMLAGALRAYANRWGVAAGDRVAVFTNNDDGLRTARDLHAKGVDVAAVIEPMVALCEASGCFKRPAEDDRPWRASNPLPVPTERERHVLAQGLPVYRVLYRRNHAAVPALEHLELAAGAAGAEGGNPEIAGLAG